MPRPDLFEGRTSSESGVQRHTPCCSNGLFIPQCSVSCGQGRQTRSVACERIFHNEEEVEENDYDASREADVEDESLCPADGRPSSQQPCNMSACSESREDEISIITVIHDCQTSRYGCCPDQITAALGENFLGCDGE
uniref:Uncharacterized protein n=1 Tax=Biomphalaria glabrata TaxID=6526 RepID=A0A2C9L4J2_BIOGL